MTELQAPTNNSSDPRWIAVRISRINLGISMVGGLLAFPIMFMIEGMSPVLRLTILVLFTLAMAWDLHLILLKGRHSVSAFYLFDRDVRDLAGRVDAAGKANLKLGIRVRFARVSLVDSGDGVEGEVLGGTFVSPWFTALRYRLPNDPSWRRYWPRIIPLWRDSIDAEEFRKVRVALKWK
jgi:hypothetical protein